MRGIFSAVVICGLCFAIYDANTGHARALWGTGSYFGHSVIPGEQTAAISASGNQPLQGFSNDA